MWKRFGLQEWFLVGFTLFATVFLLFSGIVAVGFAFVSPAPSGFGSNPWSLLSLSLLPLASLAVWYWMLWWLLPRRQFNPSWRGVKQSTPTGERVLLQPMSRMMLVWMILLATGVFVPLICGATLSDDGITFPERHGMFPTWAVAAYCTLLGLSGAFGAWRRAPWAGFVQDDEQAGTLCWRSWHPRGRERSVVRHWVTDVSVQEAAVPPFDIKTYSVVIHWKNWDDVRMSETIVRYGYEDDAEALAGWLRERLGLGERPHPQPPLHE
jgi:hypothetical protein